MAELLILFALGLALVVIGLFWRNARLRELVRRRIEEPEAPTEEPREAAPDTRRFVQHHTLIPWLVGLVVIGLLYYLVGLPIIFAVSFGLIVGLLGGQLESMRVTRVTFRIEQQLADALDLMVAALRAGAGAMGALENAAGESRRPLRPQLEEMLGRIRYGDDPQMVLRSLQARVPLETFRLFASALSVHWETGGSLAPTLATVGRVIRDRIEVTRRVRALTTQGRASTMAVMGVTYFIGLIIWRSDPDRMRQFLATTIGQGLVAGALFLQGVGMVWTAALSRMKY
jgi:Flp pilus assembly protein TadB